jgi:DNA polymerase III alpha subunit
LGITKLDPLKLDLIFERFLNPGRGPQFDHVLPIPEMSNV